MIIVTGATGQLGRAILERLVLRVSPASVGASARNPEKAAALAALGVRVRRGDFAAPETLAHAFEGATQVLLVSSSARASGGDTLAQHQAAIEAARAAGARRIVYTSHMAASASSAFAPARDHAATEAMLARSGVAWTALRNGFYASSGLAFVGDAFTTGVFEAPLDGPTAWTAHADLAEAAAAILADEGRLDGPTPALVAPEALDFTALAALASEISGRPLVRRVIPDDELRARFVARGAPVAMAEIALGFYKASRDGEFRASAAERTLEQLLGRPPIAMREVMARKLAS